MNKELEAFLTIALIFWGLVSVGGGLGYLAYILKPNLLEPKAGGARGT